MHPHLARNMGQQPMVILELHPEGGVRERLDHGAFDLDAFFLGQTRTSILSVGNHREYLGAFRTHRHGVLEMGA